MAVLDYILLGLLLFFALLGFMRGFVSQLFSIIAMVSGFIGAKIFYMEVGKWAGLEIQYGDALWFVVTFIAILLGVKLIGVLIEKILKVAKLSLFNRFCGFTLGLIKGFALCVVLVALMLFIYPEGRKIVNSSPVGSYFLKAADGIYSMVPPEVKKKIDFIDIKGAT